MIDSNKQIVNITHQELMSEARASLADNWGMAALAFLVYVTVAGAAGLIPFVTLIIGGPLALGLAIFALNISRSNKVEISDLFAGFSSFANALVAYLLMFLIVFVGFLLFIIPGIIAALGFSQMYYILADNPNKSGVDALQESWELMKGNKMDIFILGLRFIPWVLLCILTIGIGFFFLAPYAYVTYAKYYEALTNNEAIVDQASDHLLELD